MISEIADRQPRRYQAKPPVIGGKFAKKRLERSLTHAAFLRTGRVLERFQAVENQQGSPVCNEFRQSFALFPIRSDPRIRVTKPSQSGIKKFICRRSVPTGALSVEGPAKNQLRGT